MAKNNIKSKQGFTIIEVVLVLAIAGLIFLMVFIALPALQRGQRDTQRRDDMARFLSQLNQYQANNKGRLPAEGEWNSTFIPSYLKAGGDSFEDPSSGVTYEVVEGDACGSSTCPENAPVDLGGVANDGASNDVKIGTIHVNRNARCEGEKLVYVKGERKIAIRIKLEGAGVYCGNN